MIAEKLAEALRLLRDAVRAQNRSGIAWPAPVFAQMMDGLARADALLDGPGAATVQQEQAGETAGEAGTMPGTSGFTMACFHADKVPVGTKLYTRPQQPLSDEQLRLALTGSPTGHITDTVRGIAMDVQNALLGITKDTAK